MESDRIHEACSNGKLYNLNSSHDTRTNLRPIVEKGLTSKAFYSDLNHDRKSHPKIFSEFYILLRRSLLQKFRDRVSLFSAIFVRIFVRKYVSTSEFLS